MVTRTGAGSGRAKAHPEDEELLEFLAEPEEADACAPGFRDRLREDLWRLVQRLYGDAATERGASAPSLPRSRRRG